MNITFTTNKVKASYIAFIALFSIATVFIPSGSSVYAATCSPQPTALAASNNAALKEKYDLWKARYVTANGAGGDLRVQRSAGDGYDTVSEGIAYGMIFAAYMNDKTVFDKLWSYEQKHLDPLGLMHWRIGAGGNATGQNSASDADEDMALALIAADKKWGGYTQAAKKQIDLTLAHDVENGSNIFKPGDQWGGSYLLNPSYISPSYYKVFATYTGNTRWNAVATANNNVLNNIAKNTDTKNTGLVPDWSNSDGYPTNGMGYDYGYDAVRHPIRVALDSQWYCDANSTAQLNRFNSFFQNKNINTVVDGYRTNGTPIGGSNNGVAVGPIASAAVVSTNSTYRNNAWQKVVSIDTNSYYSDSIQLLSMFVASGTFVNPLELSATTPTTAQPTQPTQTTPQTSPTPTNPQSPIQQAKMDIWWPVDGSKVSGTTPFKTMLPDSSVENYSMFWQVDGGALVPMASNYEDYPHKQADVDVSGWNWRGTGPYKMTFVAKNAAGAVISTRDSNITIVR